MPRRVVPIRSAALADSRMASSSRCSGRISVAFSAMRRFSGVTLTFWVFRCLISSSKACGSSTTPLPITDSLPGRTTPEGSSESLYVVPLMTSVCPALCPPWKRTTMSACSDNQSTILPFPSSPHWAPTTTTLAIRRLFPLKTFAPYEHEPSESAPLPGPCAQLKSRPGPLACEAHNRIKDAADLGKQEGPPGTPQRAFQLLDIPVKFVSGRWQAGQIARPLALWACRDGSLVLRLRKCAGAMVGARDLARCRNEGKAKGKRHHARKQRCRRDQCRRRRFPGVLQTAGKPRAHRHQEIEAGVEDPEPDQSMARRQYFRGQRKQGAR